MVGGRGGTDGIGAVIATDRNRPDSGVQPLLRDVRRSDGDRHDTRHRGLRPSRARHRRAVDHHAFRAQEAGPDPCGSARPGQGVPRDRDPGAHRVQQPDLAVRRDLRSGSAGEDRRLLPHSVERYLAAGRRAGDRYPDDPERSATLARIGDSTEWLADHMGQVPVLVLACIAADLPGGEPGRGVGVAAAGGLELHARGPQPRARAPAGRRCTCATNGRSPSCSACPTASTRACSSPPPTTPAARSSPPSGSRWTRCCT